MASGEAQERGWFRWRPGREQNWVYEDIARAIEGFQPVDRGAGSAAAEWLKKEAIGDYPATATWLFYENGRVEGFFAIRSGNFVSQERRRDRLPGRGILKPASDITWICKHAEAEIPGQILIMRAVSIAMKVAKLQGNVALVINPYDEATAALLQRKYSFLNTARSGQLFLPVLDGRPPA